jgi:hypothetical protein
LGSRTRSLERLMTLGASGLCKDRIVGVFRFLTSFSPEFSHLAWYIPHICYAINNGSFLSFHLKM